MGRMGIAKHSCRGISLIEMLLGLVVGMIVLGLALPGHDSHVQNKRLGAAVGDFNAALHTARNFAITRRGDVAVCPSSDGIACLGSDQAWTQGLMVFIDSDLDGARSADEEIVRLLPAPHPSIDVQSTRGLNYVKFDVTGSAFSSTGEFRFCHEEPAVESRQIVVSAVGRILEHERQLKDCSLANSGESG